MILCSKVLYQALLGEEDPCFTFTCMLAYACTSVNKIRDFPSVCLYTGESFALPSYQTLLYGVRALNWVKRLHSELSSVAEAVVKQFAYARRAFKTIGAKQLQWVLTRGRKRERVKEETQRLFAPN